MIMRMTCAKCRPVDAGIDVVCESATKYLNGHSDIIAGVVAGTDKFIKKVGHCNIPKHRLSGSHLVPTMFVVAKQST